MFVFFFLRFFIDWSFIIDQSVTARRHTRDPTEEKADEDRQDKPQKPVDAKEKADQEEDQEEAREKRMIEDAEKEEENVTAVEKGERKDERKGEKKDELTAAEIKKAFDEAEDEEDVEVIWKGNLYLSSTLYVIDELSTLLVN